MKDCCAILLLLIAIWPRTLMAQRAIPDDNLAYPVLITLSDCSSNIASVQGSGFFLDAGSEEYLVTARHIVFNESERVQPGHAHPLLCNKAELVSSSRDPKDKQKNRIQLDLRLLNGAGKVKAHATRDVVVVQIGVVQKNAGGEQGVGVLTFIPGAQSASITASGLLDVGLSTVKRFDEVLTANDVYVFGYPSSIGIQQAPQIDYDSPLLRKGIVAGTNQSNKTIVLDCLTFFGNSGGPVLQAVHVGLAIRFSVIGVISQYVPVTETWMNTTVKYGYIQIHNSGYSIAEPMDGVLELIGK
ncbi:MAG: trypsin-like peptidase domain-containing protein [Terriglobales bacterium]